VVDLEKTLIGSEYDARYGWRHVKRPGLDQFLTKLSSYYEIVIFSENDVGAVAEVLFAIDPEGRCHKLGSAAAEARDGMMIKRLDYMNRDIDRIILIDDSPEAFQMFPRNTLQVKPFDDVKDSADRVLYDLVPLLQAFVHDDARDFRDTIDDLGTHEAEEAVIEWQMRVSEKKSEEQRKRNRGLGGIVRSRFAPVAADRSGDGEERLISLSSLVGRVDDSIQGAAAPANANKSTLKGYGGIALAPGMDHSSLQAQKGPVKKRQGAFFEWLENAEKDKEEHEMRKREKMNEIYAKRLREKAEKDEKARQNELDGL
jgi:import inner membrane translocase subunit TIM50